jgi:hypothetical protein
VIKTLWMTRCGCERIFLADGPGLARLQGRGYRVLRLVSRCRTVAMRLSWDLEARICAKREVTSIDAPPKPKVDVQESIANAKAYCKQNPASFVSLRDYSGGIYNETCADFAAEQHATDPSYKIGSD